MGFRVGAEPMNALGVERAKGSQLIAFVDLGEEHCATCHGNGLQVIMETTFGKGNLKRTRKRKKNEQIFANKYLTVLPSKEELKKLIENKEEE